MTWIDILILITLFFLVCVILKKRFRKKKCLNACQVCPWNRNCVSKKKNQGEKQDGKTE